MLSQFTTLKRSRKRLLLLAAFAFLVTGVACKLSPGGSDTTAKNGDASSVAGEISRTPPFATKEPVRYQATMIQTSSFGDRAPLEDSSNLTTRQTLIIRDGDRRRVDYELTPGMKVSFLQLPSGFFLLLPSRKIYAEIKPDADGDALNQAKGVSPDFSPDRLINESRAEARYDKLGREELNGRTTTKYRVTTLGPAGEAQEVTTQSLIWIDESLGMPVRSETTITNNAASPAKYTMEMRDIRQEVDATQLELPQDYKRVETKDMAQMLTGAPALSGAGRKEDTNTENK